MTDYTNPNTRKTARLILVVFLLCVAFLTFQDTAIASAQAQTLPIYVVQSGDTLSAIALKFYTTVDAIMSVNSRTSADALSIGTRLYIPGLSGMNGILTTEYAPLGASLTSLEALILFALVLGLLFASKARWLIPGVIAAAALWGWLSQTAGL